MICGHPLRQEIYEVIVLRSKGGMEKFRFRGYRSVAWYFIREKVGNLAVFPAEFQMRSRPTVIQSVRGTDADRELSDQAADRGYNTKQLAANRKPLVIARAQTNCEKCGLHGHAPPT
jgi:hypothetical protein